MLLLIIFFAGYLAIVLEHPLGINKTASALLTGISCWVVLALNSLDQAETLEALSHHLSEIAGILFFLLGAMTIVEVIDSHYGFRKITGFIRSESPLRLLWIISWTAFFLSALLDNLTTAIVMASITRKMVEDKNWRLYIVSMVVIAANAGGAWSPIGDVTTTMLWVGGQIETIPLIKSLLLPSIVSLLIPLILVSILLRKHSFLAFKSPEAPAEMPAGAAAVLITGLGGLFMVPLFKNITHLPPYLGILLVLGLVWVLTEVIHQDKNEDKSVFTPSHALSKIDTPSILFFLGILLAVSALETGGILRTSAEWLDGFTQNKSLIMAIIGLASAVVDNVPLVAAAIGMYDLSNFPAGNPMWNELAFAAGTGGSILIIGSAAGVAVMGLEKIEFIWYLKRISWIAFAGFAAGYATLQTALIL